MARHVYLIFALTMGSLEVGGSRLQSPQLQRDFKASMSEGVLSWPHSHTQSVYPSTWKAALGWSGLGSPQTPRCLFGCKQETELRVLHLGSSSELHPGSKDIFMLKEN